MIIEIIKFIVLSILIVLISKYVLVNLLRKLAESLSLKAKVVGNIAGYATSVPEFLTTIISSARGLYGTSVYNILSSNIINVIQYSGAIIVNKNLYKTRNKAIRADLIMVIITIAIPIVILINDIQLDILIIPAYLILYVLFLFLDYKVHKLYAPNENRNVNEKERKREYKNKNNKKEENGNRKKVINYILALIATAIILFIIEHFLGNTLENLCNIFNISQVIIGIILGFLTSLPELITFIESQRHHKKQNNDMLGIIEATNNLFTSNVVNLFIIQTVGIVVINMVR